MMTDFSMGAEAMPTKKTMRKHVLASGCSYDARKKCWMYLYLGKLPARIGPLEQAYAKIRSGDLGRLIENLRFIEPFLLLDQPSAA